MMTYDKAEEILYSIPMFQNVGAQAYNPSLESITTLCEKIGSPHRCFSSVHVAGTNGKGSVSHLLASTLEAAGYKCALFTSPHLLSFRERIKVCGAPISEEGVIEFMELVEPLREEIKPSFFEITCAMAFWWFAKCGVEIAVVETGLGGRLDATNIINPLVSVITNIAFDHCAILGNTLEEIASEKSGIIKPYTPSIIGEWDVESCMPIVARAKEQSSTIHIASQRYHYLSSSSTTKQQTIKYLSLLTDEEFEVVTDLKGWYQQKNVATALTTLDTLVETSKIEVSWKDIEKGFANSGLQGRWQILAENPTTVCDTGHNLAGITEVMRQINASEYQRLFMVLGFVSDKDIDAIAELLPKSATYIFTQAKVERAMDANTLAQKMKKHGLDGKVEPQIDRAITLAKTMASSEDMIYIGGSTFTVAEALTSTDTPD